MTGTPTPLPPGWYPDPNGGANQLYWDGREWHTATPPPSGQPHEPPPAMRRVRCFSCQHIQQEPMGLEKFQCEKCGQQLKPKHATQAKPAGPPPPPPPAPSGSGSNSREMAIGVGVLVIAAIGVCISAFTSASLMTGTTTQWIGVAIAGVATALAFFLGATNQVRAAAAICLFLAVSATFYMEHQLDQKRTEITKTLDSGP